MSGISNKNWTLVVAFAVLTCSAPVVAQTAWEDVYDPLQMLTLNLDMDEGDWATISGDTTFDIEVPAKFSADGEEPILVSVRRKSATPIGPKISLKIDINEYVSGQKWHSLKKLSLENGDDADVVAEGLAWYLHRVAAETSTSGYTPGLAAWVKLVVNGQNLGVYLHVEQPDKQFLKNRGLWVKGSTWFYKMSDVNSPTLKAGNGDSPTRKALCFSPFASSGGKGKKKGGSSGCDTPVDDALVAVLDNLIAMDAMLTQGAVNAFTTNPDALFTHAKNFYWVDYNDASKRVYFPWDHDAVIRYSGGSIYGQLKRGRKNGLSQTAYQEVILNDPMFRQRYDDVMAQLLAGPFDADKLFAFLDQAEVVIGAELQADPNRNFRESAATRFDELRGWLLERLASVKSQL